jgi:hypothetical protein
MNITNFKYYISALLLVLITASCTKVIDLKLRNNTGQLVIEANITNITGSQYVKLSQNVAFTSTNSYPAVSGATVAVSDDKGNNYQFTEGPTGTYSYSPMVGIPGRTYTLSVLSNVKNYTASSTMPQVVILDSITAKNSEFNSSKHRKEITIHLQDPAGISNQYRLIMYVNGAQVKSIFAFNDSFTDGRYVNIDLRQQDIDIYSGDTVTVEMQCVDKPMYTYWFTLMQQQGNNPGGGVTPSNPPTNITPICLGYFSAHTTQSKTIVVK